MSECEERSSFHREATLIVVPPLGHTRGELLCLDHNLSFDVDEPSEDLLRLRSLSRIN